MADKPVTAVIRGKLHWAKLLGEPRMNTFTNEREWSVDLTPDEESMKKVKALKIAERLRDPKEEDDRTEQFLSFRQKEFRTDPVTGEKKANRPIEVVDVSGRPWDSKTLLGNDTLADIKVTVKDYGKGKPTGVYIQAVRVLDLVPYVANTFAPLTPEEQAKFGKASEDAPAEGAAKSE